MIERDPHWHEKSVFGLHFDLHIKPNEQGTGADLELQELVDLLEAVRPDFVQCDTKGHEGIASWPTEIGTPGPDLVRDSLEIYREATTRLGIPLIAHHSGVWDQQAIALHPEWAVVGADGEADRISTSLLSAYDRDLLIPQLIEVLQRYGLDGVWVDGENWGARPDWSEAAGELFRERTGFVGELPRDAGDDGWPAWLEFHRQLFREHVSRYASAVHSAEPGSTVVSNWMYTLRQPDPVADMAVDYISGDFTPSFGNEEALPEAAFLDTRGVSWDLMIWAFTSTVYGNGWTLKDPQQLCQEAAIILSRGGVVVLYDQPTRRGRHLPWHTQAFAAVAEFCRARIGLPQGRNVADVLVLLNRAHHYASIDSLFAYSSATDAVRGAAFALFEAHETFDIATFEDPIDLSEYSTVIIPEQGSLTAHRELLETYVVNGGNLVVTGPHVLDGMDDLLGHRATAVDDSAWIYVESADGTTPVPGPWRRSERTTSTVLLSAADSDFEPSDPKPSESSPAVFRAPRGRGTVTSTTLGIFGAHFNGRYPRSRYLIENLLNIEGRMRTVEFDGPPWIGATLRQAGDLFMLHLLDLSTGSPLSPRNVSVEALQSALPVSVVLKVRGVVRSVRSIVDSDADISFTQDGDTVSFVVPSFEIHALVAIDAELVGGR